jgi:hypothetical protein
MKKRSKITELGLAALVLTAVSLSDTAKRRTQTFAVPRSTLGPIAI